ncbi:MULTISPECIES: DUF1189 family protein [unclassified Enterococcus]|uniref:DUF1189 family protein n=1 Tax=unclassified Enterococcus TaxID=2608891 RepID=UPI001556FDC4|nr:MULTISPECIES: DUF1189 family protein [unclassified Enterococcus]MBS7576453.1 DUF1189 family protein [Enterococcus sp. MMGLQ5-2]MBS7583685.1 DUF1189 family protein [Enterococcus sp. MMGLQ5-1]NPD11546.1 DUF1189 family protein [Enterococcus sp. MMGLQ5-1]NPD36290.1 DUF1189 family protein [Enterococcus sp. MMGLQ5-2]
MIDRLMTAVKLDFSAMIKKPAEKIKQTMSTLIVSILLVGSINALVNISQLDIKLGISQLSQQTYTITEGEVNIDSNDLEQLNEKLQNSGISIQATKISFGKQDSLSFEQIQLLFGKSQISSDEINELLKNYNNFIVNFIFFYFYFKELLFAVWMIILVIVLSRTTQKYLRNRVEVKFEQVFDWISSLATLPLFLYLILNSIGLRWSMRVFIITLLYTLLVFIFTRFSFSHLKIEEEN